MYGWISGLWVISRYRASYGAKTRFWSPSPNLALTNDLKAISRTKLGQNATFFKYFTVIQDWGKIHPLCWIEASPKCAENKSQCVYVCRIKFILEQSKALRDSTNIFLTDYNVVLASLIL